MPSNKGKLINGLMDNILKANFVNDIASHSVYKSNYSNGQIDEEVNGDYFNGKKLQNVAKSVVPKLFVVEPL